MYLYLSEESIGDQLMQLNIMYSPLSRDLSVDCSIGICGKLSDVETINEN